MRPSKPAFQSVVDLGLRDVGVKNQPRRLAAHFGKAAVPVAVSWGRFRRRALRILRQTGADVLVVVAFAVAWTAGMFVVACW